MSSALLTALAVATCIGMLVVAHRIEPHWISKDQQRFLTTCEEVDRLGTVVGRRKEVRGAIADDGRVVLRHRSFLRSTNIVYAIQAKSPRPPAGKALYVLRPVPAAADGSLLVLRLPSSSVLVGILDALGTESDTAAIIDATDADDVNAPPPDP